jgi:D-serine deaminase-like pyridoxal phosphate-dependent protein
MAVHPTPPVPSGLGEVRSLNVSAEHATIELAEAAAMPEIGDRLEFVCGYGDSTLFLHDELYGVRDGRVETVWAILGRGKTR